MDFQEFEQRKKDHIQYALDQRNQANESRSLDRVHLYHDALPELDFTDVSLLPGGTFVGATSLKTPFFISGMTAGHEQAVEINYRLASACEKRGWIFGLGSQRKDLGSSADGSTMTEWKRFREEFPELVLLGNIGLSQVIESSVDEIQSLVQQVKASALAVHLNAHQEVIQKEGTPQFKGGLKAIQTLASSLSVPLILKETGCGFSVQTLKKLKGESIAAIDVSGLGGTHWGRIEGARVSPASIQAKASGTFANWGETTVDSVLSAKEVFSNSENPEIWASGGVRSGLDAAKFLALGAHRVGFAMPALKAAIEGDEALDQWMALMEFELQVALFGTGCGSVEALRLALSSYRLD